jgi:hypothetical protein
MLTMVRFIPLGYLFILMVKIQISCREFEGKPEKLISLNYFLLLIFVQIIFYYIINRFKFMNFMKKNFEEIILFE